MFTGNYLRKRVHMAGALTAVLVVSVAAAVFSFGVRADTTSEETFTVDIAQDSATNAQNNVDPKQTDPSAFSRGDTFLIGGTIYRANTIASGAPNNDPTVPGIGKVTFRGTYATSSLTAPVNAFTTELFSFSDGTILTDGNWPNEKFSADRVVLGGTGAFRYVVGEVHEQNLGFNRSGFCNLRVTFKLRRVPAQH